MRYTTLGCSVAVLLAACGGAGSPDEAAAPPQDAMGGEQRATALAAATASWSPLAGEYETFDAGSTARTVRFGAGNAWIEKTVSGRVPCTNEFFGRDPAFMVLKRCEVLSGDTAAPAPAPAPAPADAGWAWVAGEGGAFSVAGTQTVRYGSGNQWLQRAVANGGACTNAFFGTDPAFMKVKRCEVSTAAAAAAPAPAPTPPPTPAPTPAPTPTPAPSAGARSQAAVFVSGHSLTARPIWANMEAVAASLGTPLQWNQQIINGSPIRVRARGNALDDPSFPGYRTGENRNGSNLDVVAELRAPGTVTQRYDTLVLTERHDIVSTLMWEDTVRYTRHFHDRAVAGNPSLRTQLYHSWLPIADKGDPAPWLQYERTAARAWQCTAARVNLSLAAQGRADRVNYMPAGLALADLVEQAALRGTVAGVSGGGVAATVERLFSDDVHLTALGQYYMSLVGYATVYGRSPAGGWAPAGVTAQQAAALQGLAWQSVSTHLAASAEAPSMATCQAAMRDQVCGAYANHIGRPDIAGGCAAHFSTAASSNPFHYDAASDAAYWFAAPR